MCIVAVLLLLVAFGWYGFFILNNKQNLRPLINENNVQIIWGFMWKHFYLWPQRLQRRLYWLAQFEEVGIKALHAHYVPTQVADHLYSI